MKITNIKDVKVGYYITFRSYYNDVLSRKFYEIIFIDNKSCKGKTLYKKTYNYNISIDNLFECSDDEVFSTFEDLKEYYPEEFI